MASTDLATLGINITTTGADRAATELNNVATAGKQAESQAGALSKGLDSLGYSLNGIQKLAAQAAAAFAMIKLIDLVKDSTLLAARYETLGVVMQTIGKTAGYTQMQMSGFQASLQKTGISAIEARQGLALMGQAQIDFANSAKLARIAQDAAVIGNINSSEAFNRMMTGLATGQSIILHHLGLMTNFEDAYLKAAHAANKTTNDLTENEKAQIRVNEVLRAGAGIAGTYEAAMGTVGKQLTSLPRYFNDLMVQVGSLGSGVLFTVVSKLTEQLKWLTNNFDAVIEKATIAAGVIGGILAVVTLPQAILATTAWFTALGSTATAVTTLTTGIAGEIIATTALTGSTGFLATALTAAEGAMVRLTASMLANPWVYVTGLIVGTTTALLMYVKAKTEAAEKQANTLSESDKIARENAELRVQLKLLEMTDEQKQASKEEERQKRINDLKAEEKKLQLQIYAIAAQYNDGDFDTKHMDKLQERLDEVKRQITFLPDNFKLTDKTAAALDRKKTTNLPGATEDDGAAKAEERRKQKQEQIDKFNQQKAIDYRKAIRDIETAADENAFKAQTAALDKQQVQLDISHQARLFSEMDYLKKSQDLIAAKNQLELDQAQKHAADIQKQALENKVATFILDDKNGGTSNLDLKQAEERKKLTDEANKLTIESVKAQGAIQAATDKVSLQTEKDKLATAVLTTSEIQKQFEINNKIKDAQNANATFAASQVGVNSATGEVTDPVANAKSIAEQQLQITQDRIAREMEMFWESEQFKRMTLEESIAFAKAKKKESDDAELVSAQKIAKAQADATNAGYQSMADFASKTFPKITGFHKLASIAEMKYDRDAANNNELSSKGRMKMASDVAGFIGGTFNDIAAMQDTSSRSGFETAKAMQMGATVVNTAAAIMLQMSGGDALTAIPRAAATAAMGAVQLAMIASTSFGGSGGGVAAPSGSFASGGASGSGSTSGIGSAVSAIQISVADSQTGTQLDAISTKMGNAALAMGKSADSLYVIADVMKSDYMKNVAGGAPGISTGLQSQSSRSGLTAGDIASYALSGMTFGVGTLISKIADLFGGSRVVGSGFTVGTSNGEGYSRTFTDRDSGNWLTGSKRSTSYGADNKFNDYISTEIDKMTASLRRNAVALGVSGEAFDANLTKVVVAETKIQTAGRKQEDILKDLEAAFNKTSITIAEGTTPSLKEYALYNESQAATLDRLGSSIRDVNAEFQNIGKALLEVSYAGGDAAYDMQLAFGGAEKFASAMKDYLTGGMFTEAQQNAMKQQSAYTDVFRVFGSQIPKTKAEFISLVNATTDPQMLKSLMDVSQAFVDMTDLAQKAADDLRSFNNDLNVRELQANGKSYQADILSMQIKFEDEMKTAIENGMDTTRLATVQGLEMDKYISDARLAANKELLDAQENFNNVMGTSLSGIAKITQQTATALANSASKMKTALTAQLDIQKALVQTIITLKSGPLALLSPEAAYRQAKNTFANAKTEDLPAAATALMEASKNYNASGLAYQNDMAMVLDKLGSETGLGSNPTLDLAQAQLDKLEEIRKAIDSGDLENVKALSSVVGSNAGVNTALMEYIKIATSAANANNIAINAQNAATAESERIAREAAATRLAEAEKQKALVNAPIAPPPKELPGRPIQELLDEGLKFAMDAIQNASAMKTLSGVINSTGYSFQYDSSKYNYLGVNDNGDMMWQKLANGQPTGDFHELAPGVVPSFAIGSPYIPHDMNANIHQGEMIIDRSSADALRKYGVPVNGGDNSKVVSILDRIEARLAKVEAHSEANVRVNQAGHSGTIKAVEQAGSDTQSINRARLAAAA